MSDRVYRQAFFVALVTCAALAATVGYLFLHRSHLMPAAPPQEVGDPVVARGPAASGNLAG